MTRDDITRMALEAGFADSNGVVHAFYQLERFAALVAAAEREACAKVCEEIANKPSNMVLGVALDCATAVRARGEK